MDASSTYSHRQYQPSAYSTSVFSEDDSLVQPVANGITSNYRMEFRDKVHPVEDADANDIENSKTSVEFQLSEDEAEGGEGNQLTRVYSDVDSIFSTKVDVSPKKKGLFH
ncbi:hypothetical protein PSN45_003847 [Yamadazyma tenuis]|nr:hypothetical protein PSN45_003847 [Yamadazyma tenuis]